MNTQDSATKKDLEGLQGTWSLVSAMEDDNSLAGDKVKETTIVIRDNTFRFPQLAEDATSKAGTFKLDATKTPKQMDTISTEKEVMLGIYELEGDSTRSASRRSASHAPANSPRKSGSDNILQVWERQKSRSRSAEADHWLDSIIESAHSLR